MIGLICPSKFEYQALDKTALKTRRVAVQLSGMGKLRAFQACVELKRKNAKLRSILMIGFAGSLTKTLPVGAVVEPKLFVEQDYYAEPFERFPNSIQRKAAKQLKESHEVVMLTQDRFLTENPYKNDGRANVFKKIACDMESYAVAYFSKVSGTPSVVAKIISDLADESADHDFLKACRELSPKLNRITLELIDKMQRSQK